MAHFAGESPGVSVILTTCDRPRFLTMALACFRQQTYPERELIVVDDGVVHPADRDEVEMAGGFLIRVDPGTPLGTKLNVGVAAARGPLCQKMDDDDWYAPEFLETMVGAVAEHSQTTCRPTIAFLMPFLFFDLARWEVRQSIPTNAPGATLLFAREDWQERPFRALVRDEDVWFILDQFSIGTSYLPVRRPEVFMAVRHGGSADRGHTWRNYGVTGLEEYLRDRPLWKGGPESLLPSWALAVYRGIHDELVKRSSPPALIRAG
jgi:glycosyltransferase involved in cell wall biosynthesis